MELGQGLHYFETLNFRFQEYFRDQLRRALTFFVQASIPNLFVYMTAALTFGPCWAYAESKFLSTRDARTRLRDCILFAINDLKDRDEVASAAIFRDVRYYIPQIYNTDSSRREVSHLIFDAIKETGGTSGQIRWYVNDYGLRYEQTILDRLVDLNCITRDGEFFEPNFYTINFPREV